jgi:hypothetical protein
MKRVFILNDDESELSSLLNQESVFVKHIKINCDRKTAITTVTVDYENSPDFKIRGPKRKRKIKRFHLIGGQDEFLDYILSSKDFRVIQQHDFSTSNGVVIVVDFEDRR